MTIQQTIDIPASHRLTIDIPHEIPAGRTVLAFISADQAALNAGAKQRRNRELEAAAALAAEDYRNDPELTAFCALDGENFHETR